MKNITELRVKLSKVFIDVEKKKLEPRQAKEMINAAGKIINTVAMQLRYAEHTRTVANIPFMK